MDLLIEHPYAITDLPRDDTYPSLTFYSKKARIDGRLQRSKGGVRQSSHLTLASQSQHILLNLAQSRDLS